MRAILPSALVLGLASAGCRSTTPTTIGPLARDGSAITVEWIYGDEGRAVGSVPSFAWRTDGRALVFDGSIRTQLSRLRASLTKGQ